MTHPAASSRLDDVIRMLILRRSVRRGPTLALLLALVVGACAAPARTLPPPSASTPGPTVSPSLPSPSPLSPTPRPSPPPTSYPSLAPSPPPSPSAAASCVARTLASLDEAQRIGQLFMVGLAGDRLDAAARDAIVSDHLGSWWFTETTSQGVEAVRAVSDAVQARVSERATGSIGFFVAANQEGGRIQALAGPGFDTIPSAVVQGTWSASTLQARALRWGRQLLAAGVNLDFAPVADVVPEGTAAGNAPIGALDREYGAEPAAVADHVAAFIAGMTEAGVATTAKHFPGLGRVAQNTDFSSGVVDDVTTADDPFLGPFRRAVDAGVPAVMVSLATYERIDPDRIAAFSWRIIGGILEDDMGYGGVVMSDSLSAEAVSSIPAGTRAIRFLDEGGDMIVVRPVSTAIEMAAAIAAHARDDSWFRDRIDNAVLHVLRAKDAAGLLPCSG